MFKAVIFQLYGVIINHENILTPFVADLLKSLHKNGIKLMISSNCFVKDIEELLDFHQIKQYFIEYPSQSMMDSTNLTPQRFYSIPALLKVRPEECLAIVSSEEDIAAAKETGMIDIGYSSQDTSDQSLSKATILIQGFEEMDYACLKELYLLVSPEPITVLTTDRLLLRELTIDDIPRLYEMYQDPKLHSFQYDFQSSLEEEIDKHNAYIKNVYRYYGFGLWGIFLKSSNRLIGRCGVELKIIEGQEEYELGYMLAFEYQGKGYAKEATKAVIDYTFQNLPARRVVAVIDQENLPSLILAKRLGMICDKELIRAQRKYWLYMINNDLHGKGAGNGSNS